MCFISNKNSKVHRNLKFIRTYYGNHVLILFRKYEKLRAKRDKLQLDIAFLTTCVDENITPTFLFFRTSSSNNRFSHSYHKAQMLFLHDEIKAKKCELKTCHTYLQEATENCRLSLSQLLFLVLQSTCNNN